MKPDIAHDAVRCRFQTRVEGEHCTLDYTLDAQTMTITHVVVPGPVGGRGIAAALMEAALTHARTQGWCVVPQCPYAAHYLDEHAGWSDVLVQR
jgi:predicted GNAT family acetyltransferase